MHTELPTNFSALHPKLKHINQAFWRKPMYWSVFLVTNMEFIIGSFKQKMNELKYIIAELEEDV